MKWGIVNEHRCVLCDENNKSMNHLFLIALKPSSFGPSNFYGKEYQDNHSLGMRSCFGHVLMRKEEDLMQQYIRCV